MTTIRAIALDVDGVLTDDGLYLSTDSAVQKRFSVRDRSGLWRALEGGLRVALISGDSTPDGGAIVRAYASTLGLSDVWLGCHDKVAALNEFAARCGLSLSELCFMGDDVADVRALEIAGLAAAPCNAHPLALKAAAWIATARGGHGAVRELIDGLLSGGHLHERSIPQGEA